MSLEAFVSKIKSDAALRSKIEAMQASVPSGDNSAIDQALVRIAAEEGFTISLEEIASYEKAYKELSDEDLEAVAGGIGCNNTVTCQWLSLQDSPRTGCKICV